MTCTTVSFGNGGTAIVCTRTTRKPVPVCSVCNRVSATRECDGKNGRKRCNAPLCDQCRIEKGGDDFCPAHRTGNPPKKVSGAAITMEVLNQACRDSRYATYPWSRDELREILVAAGARWDLGGLVDVPEGNRKGLISDLSHHPSWWKDKIRFCAALPPRTTYKELAAACEALGWVRPSHLDDAGRHALYALLDDEEGVLWTALRKAREPAPAVVAEASAAPPPVGSLFHQERPEGDLHAWHRLHPAIDDVWDLGPASGWRWKVIPWQPVTVFDVKAFENRQVSADGRLRILAIGPEGKSYETWMDRDGFARSLICAHLVEPIQIRSDVPTAFTSLNLDFTGRTGVLFGEHSPAHHSEVTHAA